MNNMTPDNVSEEAKQSKELAFCVIGVGGAGCKVVSSMYERGLSNARMIAIDTDATSLQGCQAHHRLLIGINATRGMGTGGDPEHGKLSALECTEELRELIGKTDIVFILAGLGRGTGTGSSPIVAQVAKEAGALTLCIATMPFYYEGVRAKCQALMGARALRGIADGIICIPNDSFRKILPYGIKLNDNIRTVNSYLADGVYDFWRILSYPGEMSTTFGDLCSMLQGKHAKSLMISIEVPQGGRAEKFCDDFLKHPLTDGGNALADAQSVLINFISNGDVTIDEVRGIMDFIKKYAKKAFFKVGDSMDPAMNGRLRVAVLTASDADAEYTAFIGRPTEYKDKSIDALKIQLGQPEKEVQNNRPDPAIVPPPPNLTEEEMAKIYQQKAKGFEAKLGKLVQGSLNFEVVSHSRFEKTAPTVHKGENLDIPTFIRKSIKLN